MLPDKGVRSADAFLTVSTKRAGPLRGEGTSPGHEQAIVVHGFHFGVQASSAIGSTQATSRRQYKVLRVTKKLDTSTTSLMSVLATNDEVKELKLTLRKPGSGADDFFKITLAGARVTEIDITCDQSGDAVEEIAVAFTKIDVEYRVQGAGGILGASHVFSDEILLSA